MHLFQFKSATLMYVVYYKNLAGYVHLILDIFCCYVGMYVPNIWWHFLICFGRYTLRSVSGALEKINQRIRIKMCLKNNITWNVVCGICEFILTILGVQICQQPMKKLMKFIMENRELLLERLPRMSYEICSEIAKCWPKEPSYRQTTVAVKWRRQRFRFPEKANNICFS